MGCICPAVASSSLIVDFHSVVPEGIEMKIVLASPLGNEANGRTREFLEKSGINVIHLKSLNNVQSRETEKLPRSAAYTFARQAYAEAPDADSIYIPSGSWCPSWVVDYLERDLGVTVLHSRQVTTWAGLRSLRIKEPVKGWGRLFNAS